MPVVVQEKYTITLFMFIQCALHDSKLVSLAKLRVYRKVKNVTTTTVITTTQTVITTTLVVVMTMEVNGSNGAYIEVSNESKPC